MKLQSRLFTLFFVSAFFSPLLLADTILCPKLLPDGKVDITTSSPNTWEVTAEVTEKSFDPSNRRETTEAKQYNYIASTGLWPNANSSTLKPLQIKSGAFTNASSFAYLEGGIQHITLKCEGNYSGTETQNGIFSDSEKPINGNLIAELTVTYTTCTLQQTPLGFTCN